MVDPSYLTQQGHTLLTQLPFEQSSAVVDRKGKLKESMDPWSSKGKTKVSFTFMNEL